MVDPRVAVMRERQARERSGLLRAFIDATPWFRGEIDGDNTDNWTPEENAAWAAFTAEIDARHQRERRDLASEMGYATT